MIGTNRMRRQHGRGVQWAGGKIAARLATLDLAVGVVNGLFSCFFGAGFFYKTFVGPFRGTAFWMLCESFNRTFQNSLPIRASTE